MGVLRQHENEKYKCPIYNGRTVRNGINHRKKLQKRVCYMCGYQYVDSEIGMMVDKK